jgi:Streptomyces sporulation and cell division protein, SsgA.
MNSSVHMLSEVMAGSMTTADGTADVAVRLTYKPRDPHALTVTITDRAGVVLIWTIGRDLLLRGLIAQASRPAGVNRIRLWTCQHHDRPSLMIAMMTSFVAFLELDLENVAGFAIATLQLVPQGEEPGQLDLDAELERLTA